MKISDLQPGNWFRYPELKRVAQLLRLGASGATVRFSDEYRPVTVTEYSDVELVSHGDACDGSACSIPPSQEEPVTEK